MTDQPQTEAEPQTEVEPQAEESHMGFLTKVLLAVILLTAGMMAMNKFYFAQPKVPEFDTAGLHPDVVKVINDAQMRVQSSGWSAESWGHLGMLAWVYQFNEQAETCFRRSMKLDPAQVRWPYYLGLVLQPADEAEAFQHYQTALELEPDLDFVRMRVAEFLLQAGDFEKARSTIEPILDMEGSSGRAEFRMAQIELNARNLKEALEWSGKAAQRAPQRREIYELAAQIQEGAGNSEAARRAQLIAQSRPAEDQPWPDAFVLEARQLRVDPEYFAFRAKQAFAAGAIEPAIALYEQLVERESDNKQFRTELGQMLYEVNETEKAMAVLEQGVEQHPDSAPMVGMLASTYLKAQQWQKAADMYRNAIELRPNYSPFYLDLGYSQIRLDNIEEATKHFEKAIEYAQDSTDTTLQIADLLTQHAHVELARKHIEAVLELDPRNEAAAALLKRIDSPDEAQNKNGPPE